MIDGGTLINRANAFSRQVAQQEPLKILLHRNKSNYDILRHIFCRSWDPQKLLSSPLLGQGRSIRWRRLRGSKSMWSRSWSTDVWCLPTQTASTALAPAFKMTLHPPQVTCSEVSFFLHPPSKSLRFMAILQSPPSPVPALPPEESQAGSQQPSKTYCPQAQTQAWPGPQHCLSFPLTPKMWREV